MSNTKDIELFNVTTEEMVKKLHSARLKILEEFTKAYLAETQLFPSQVELCCQETRENNIITHTYFFKVRNETKA